MAEGVIADLVALLPDAPHQVLPAFDPTAHQKERGPDAPPGQALQQPGGVGRGGAVVKGQGHVHRLRRRFRRRTCRFRRGAARQHQQQGQNYPRPPPHTGPSRATACIPSSRCRCHTVSRGQAAMPRSFQGSQQI